MVLLNIRLKFVSLKIYRLTTSAYLTQVCCGKKIFDLCKGHNKGQGHRVLYGTGVTLTTVYMYESMKYTSNEKKKKLLLTFKQLEDALSWQKHTHIKQKQRTVNVWKLVTIIEKFDTSIETVQPAQLGTVL